MATSTRTDATPTSSSELHATANAFVAALASLDVERMLALRTADCQHLILPKSLGRSPLSNDEFRNTYASFLKQARFSNFNITTHSTAVDVPQQKVVLHASCEATTIAGPWKSEYVFWLTMVQEQEGQKLLLLRVEEFVDSKLTVEQGGRVREAIASAKEEEMER